MYELVMFFNFSDFIASWTEPVLLIWFKRANVFCFESTSSKDNLLNLWLSCGFMIHWCHFEVKSWLTRATSVSFLCSSHHFSTKCELSHRKTNENCFLTIQFHSFWSTSGGVTGVPGGSKKGPFRCFGGHFGIAIPMSWATWGPLCTQSIDNVTKQTC